MQVKDTVRLNKNSQTLLKFYHDDVNLAIEAIKNRILFLERELEKNKTVADTLQQAKLHWTNTGPPAGSHDKKYWDELKEKVKEAVTELQG